MPFTPDSNVTRQECRRHIENCVRAHAHAQLISTLNARSMQSMNGMCQARIKYKDVIKISGKDIYIYI